MISSEEKIFDDKFVPDKFKTQEMCDNAVIRDPKCLEYVPDQFKTKICVIMLSL